MSGLAALLVGRRPAGMYHWHSHLPLVDVAHAIEHAHWRPLPIDGRGVTDGTALLDAICAAAQVPEPEPRDWAALAGSLTDLSWLRAEKGVVVVYDGWGMLARTDPDAWAVARGAFADACVRWAQTSTPFAVLLRGAGPDDDLPDLA